MIRISPTDRVFVLTGAGISAESGLPTFRGMNGVWRKHRAGPSGEVLPRLFPG